MVYYSIGNKKRLQTGVENQMPVRLYFQHLSNGVKRMVRLKTLIQHIAETCQIVIIQEYDENKMINRVDFLNKDVIPDPDTLYICTDEELLKNHQIQTILRSVGEPLFILSICREEVPLPVIQMSRMPDPQALFTCINNKLKFESRLQREVNILYHLLYNGHGLDDLIKQAELFLDRPISVLDASYSMIAVSPLMRQLPFGLETSDEGIFLSVKEVESLRRLQIERQIYDNNTAFFVQTEDHPDTNWVFCSIRIQHVMSGYVAVCLPGTALASEHELRLTKEIADICAIEMQKHDFFVQRTGLQYETFLTELLDGRFNDVNVIESRLRLLNRRFGKFFCLAVLYCMEPHNSDLFNKRQMSTLRHVYPNCMSVVYKNNIVLLINQDTPVQLTSGLTDPLEQFARRNHLKAGISQPFADVLKIRIFYHQALHTLELSDISQPEQFLFFSTEALPQYLFSNCDYQGLEIGIHYHIFQLQDYDKEYHTDFIGTLRAYLDNDRNAAKTAEYLHIHRSTFFYRIKKIEELLDISISDSHLLFLYELSFKIWDYLCR